MTDFYGGFTAGLRVHTDRGPVAIDELNVGDRVLSRTPSTGESSFMPIIRTFTHRDRPIRCVTYLLEGRMIGVMATDDVSFGVAVAAGSLIKERGLEWQSMAFLRESLLPDGRVLTSSHRRTNSA